MSSQVEKTPFSDNLRTKPTKHSVFFRTIKQMNASVILAFPILPQQINPIPPVLRNPSLNNPEPTSVPRTAVPSLHCLSSLIYS